LKNFTLYILVFIVVLAVFAHFSSDKIVTNVPYSSFVAMVKEDEVRRVQVSQFNLLFEDTKNNNYSTTAPQAMTPPYLELLLGNRNITVEFTPLDEWPRWLTFLFNLAPWVLFIGLWFYFINHMQGGSPRGMSFGRSRAKSFNESKEKINFDNVAGCDEAKEELREIIEFLKFPKKFKKTGARVPRGVLMMGPPGTGKTLLARAVAGEANVPFFHISGSDFVEMFVGVGASRVRDLFDQGKKSAPCLIFIDEIDAVGRHRGQGISGGNDEREQTLNQLLVEMDGFDNDTGIMLIAATNRPDILDHALLRPGRFDRQVVIDLPDIKGREGILRVHLKNVPTNEDVEVEVLAKSTPGFSGADLANMVNEAALYAAKENLDYVYMHHFEDAKDKVMMGPERRSRVLSEKEVRNTAFHEAGHALVNILVPNGSEIHKATIIPRGRTLGMVSFLPKEESHTKEEYVDNICVALAGRAAETIIFKTNTPGAVNDIEQATKIARAMITKWGMSDNLGMINYTENSENFFGIKSYSEETARRIDEEIFQLVDTQFKRALKLLEDNRENLVRIAETLITHETLTLEELNAIIAGDEIGPPRLRKNGTSNENTETENEESTEAEKDEEKGSDDALFLNSEKENITAAEQLKTDTGKHKRKPGDADNKTKIEGNAETEEEEEKEDKTE
jgi:cell division protease FtsH